METIDNKLNVDLSTTTEFPELLRDIIDLSYLHCSKIAAKENFQQKVNHLFLLLPSVKNNGSFINKEMIRYMIGFYYSAKESAQQNDLKAIHFINTFSPIFKMTLLSLHNWN